MATVPSSSLFVNLLLPCLLATTIPLSQSQPYNNETDRLALLSFKSMISDDPLHALGSWNTSLDVCQWQGVVCNVRGGQRRVTALYLNDLNLAGSLSPSLGNLTFLNKLHLPNNRLHGLIPQELGFLLHLHQLNLRDNMLRGEILSNLSKCSYLQTLSLMNNSLTGEVPSSLGSLKELTTLLLSDNELEAGDWSFVDALANCSNLRDLEVEGNKLQGTLPASIANLSTTLEFLTFQSNQISGSIPPDMANLVNLQQLSFNFNLLTGTIPDSIGRISKLSILSLGTNRLSGTIPPSLGNLSSLTQLYLANNSLIGGIPSSLGNPSSLQNLILIKNNLVGEIPASFSNLSSLNILGLSINQLTGGIPASLGKLSTLSVFAVSANLLTGAIPPSLYNLSSLRYLELAVNSFQGTLPMYVGQRLPHLKMFTVFGNQFHGPIPISLANASSLEAFEANNNLLTGTIPPSLGKLVNLSRITLDYNQLETNEASDWSFLTALSNCTDLIQLSLDENKLGGTLPNSIANLSTRLESLTMSRNRISGIIPADIGNLGSLTSLDLHSNLLHSTVPSEIGKLQWLHILTLSSNRFSGEVPQTLGNLTLLNELYLDDNELFGSIPISLGNCESLALLNLTLNKLTGTVPKAILAISAFSKYLGLAHNALTGPLPSEVGNLRNLQMLDISYNNLSGEIPSDISKCQSLEDLYVEKNFFYGLIPSDLSYMRGLKSLDLSQNHLSGPIPEFLGQLNLSYLNLSYNDLEGEVPQGGIFANATAVSIIGNKNLCGGRPELSLPTCNTRHQSSNRTIIISVVVSTLCLVLLLCFVLLYWRKKSRRQHSTSTSIIDQPMNLSYSELLKATNGFSDENLIGVGSFGSVYKGILDQSEQVVAVKVLNLQQPGASSSFIAECEALRSVRHRNIVRILTACSSIDFRGNDFKALVFEFLPKGSLEKWMHPKVDENGNVRKLTLIERLNIAIDVATAVEYLHCHGPTPIIHCDLKPSNILLDDGMTAHVGDFGLAKFLSRTHSKASPNTANSISLRGSIGYIAPEYGIGNEITTHGDVYSYGILLSEMLTGRRPTDPAFKDDLDLHKFVEMAIPDQIIDIIDPNLLLQEEDRDANSSILNINKAKEDVVRSIYTLLSIGIMCSNESPMERMQIRDVTRELHNIRDALIAK